MFRHESKTYEDGGLTYSSLCWTAKSVMFQYEYWQLPLEFHERARIEAYASILPPLPREYNT